MDEPIKPSDWINARNIKNQAPKPRPEPKIDPEVSKIVGRPIRVNDPTLIKVVNKWREYNTSETKPDRHLDDRAKHDDLKKAFNERKYI